MTPKRENIDLELKLERSFVPVLENFGFSIAPFSMGNINLYDIYFQFESILQIKDTFDQIINL